DNAFSYSINQSAREALYTPTSRDEKYKAKAFIDMFVQRFAKAVAVGIALLMSSLIPEGDVGDARWLSIVVLAVVAVWVFAARYAGKRFRQVTRGAAAGSAGACCCSPWRAATRALHPTPRSPTPAPTRARSPHRATFSMGPRASRRPGSTPTSRRACSSTAARPTTSASSAGRSAATERAGPAFRPAPASTRAV